MEGAEGGSSHPRDSVTNWRKPTIVDEEMAHNLDASRTSCSAHPSHNFPSYWLHVREGIFFVWPGSMGLMVLENQPSPSTVLSVWVILVVSNAVLYSSVGLVFWYLSHSDHSPSGTSETKGKK